MQQEMNEDIGLDLCISGASHVSESPLFLSLILTHTGTHLSYPASTLCFPYPPLPLPTCSQLSYLSQAHSHLVCTAKIVWPLVKNPSPVNVQICHPPSQLISFFFQVRTSAGPESLSDFHPYACLLHYYTISHCFLVSMN